MVDRLAWVTAREARGRDDDEPLGLTAVRRRGVAVELVDWDDPEVAWSRFDRVVLRSAWDYPQRLPEFLPWLAHVDGVSDLVNPLPMVRWSLDKRYLADLAEGGVRVTPTAFVPPGSTTTFPEEPFVVKPSVGAGSRDAAWYESHQHDAAGRHVARLHELGQVVLVQPKLASVATDGEWPLVFFDGQFSHAANKRVTLPHAGEEDDLFAAEVVVEHVASAAQVEVAAAAVAWVSERFGTPSYARVDVVRDDAGRCCVLEVELVEPSLFLPYDPAAADRLAAALDH